jgi:hypothetical protein
MGTGEDMSVTREGIRERFWPNTVLIQSLAAAADDDDDDDDDASIVIPLLLLMLMNFPWPAILLLLRVFPLGLLCSLC